MEEENANILGTKLDIQTKTKFVISDYCILIISQGTLLIILFSLMPHLTKVGLYIIERIQAEDLDADEEAQTNGRSSEQSNPSRGQSKTEAVQLSERDIIASSILFTKKPSLMSHTDTLQTIGSQYTLRTASKTPPKLSDFNIVLNRTASDQYPSSSNKLFQPQLKPTQSNLPDLPEQDQANKSPHFPSTTANSNPVQTTVANKTGILMRFQAHNKAQQEDEEKYRLEEVREDEAESEARRSGGEGHGAGEKQMCLLCQQREASAMSMSCKHAVSCTACIEAAHAASSSVSCPMCSTPVHSVLFFAPHPLLPLHFFPLHTLPL